MKLSTASAAGRGGRLLLRLFLLGLVITVLSACNRVSFLYDRADWLVERWVAGKLDPTRQQLVQWRPVLAEGLERHRRSELPVLVAFLEAVERHAADGLERRDVACLFDMADSIYRRHARLAAEVALPLLPGLSARQVDHLAASLAEDAEEYREDYLQHDLQERAADRARRVTKRIERWTGRLDAAQREVIAAGLGGIPDLAPDWLDYRLAREATLLQLLYSGVSDDELHRFLIESWVDLEERPPAMKERLERARKQLIELLSVLDGQLSAAQRERCVGRVSKLREDVSEMMAGHGPVRTADLPAAECASAG